MPNYQKINLDVSYAETCTNLMKQMKTDWESKKLEPPETQGSGKLVNEIQDMAKVYSELHASFLTMLDNTLSFMDVVKDDFIEKDKTMAEAMR